MSTTSPPVNTSPDHHIYHTLENIKKLAHERPNETASNEIIHRFAFLLSKLSEVASNNALKQERIALEAREITEKNCDLQTKVVNLTWALLFLTFVLTLVAGIQVYYLIKSSTP